LINTVSKILEKLLLLLLFIALCYSFLIHLNTCCISLRSSRINIIQMAAGLYGSFST